MNDLKLNKQIPFFMVPNGFVDKQLIVKDIRKNETRNISNSEKIILLYLIRCCNNGSTAFPSYNLIAEKCNMSRRNAMYCIENLVESGYITKKQRGYSKYDKGCAKNYSNIYILNLEKFE